MSRKVEQNKESKERKQQGRKAQTKPTESKKKKGEQKKEDGRVEKDPNLGEGGKIDSWSKDEEGSEAKREDGPTWVRAVRFGGKSDSWLLLRPSLRILTGSSATLRSWFSGAISHSCWACLETDRQTDR